MEMMLTISGNMVFTTIGDTCWAYSWCRDITARGKHHTVSFNARRHIRACARVRRRHQHRNVLLSVHAILGHHTKD